MTLHAKLEELERQVASLRRLIRGDGSTFPAGTADGASWSFVQTQAKHGVLPALRKVRTHVARLALQEERAREARRVQP